MKYLRFITRDNRQCAGVLESERTIRLVEGDILSGYRLTDSRCETADIKEWRSPMDFTTIICLAGSYAEHAIECKTEVRTLPMFFLKAISSVTAHKSVIRLPAAAPTQVDYEGELGVIIRDRARNLAPEEADDHILGYTCANDISARDCQHSVSQWTRGKSFDTFAPVGPFIETELDPSDVGLRLYLNGTCMQDDSTRNLIISVREIVSYLSHNLTLLPGTLIMTGTPGGVGSTRNPPVFLKSGDTVAVEIDNVGRLENTVDVEEKAR